MKQLLTFASVLLLSFTAYAEQTLSLSNGLLTYYYPATTGSQPILTVSALVKGQTYNIVNATSTASATAS